MRASCGSSGSAADEMDGSNRSYELYGPYGSFSEVPTSLVPSTPLFSEEYGGVESSRRCASRLVDLIDPLQRARAAQIKEANSRNNPLRVRDVGGRKEEKGAVTEHEPDEGEEHETLAQRKRRLFPEKEAVSISTTNALNDEDSRVSICNESSSQSVSHSASRSPSSMSSASVASIPTRSSSAGGSTLASTLESIDEEKQSPPPSPVMKLEKRPLQAESQATKLVPKTLSQAAESEAELLHDGTASLSSILERIGFSRVHLRQGDGEDDEDGEEHNRAPSESLFSTSKALPTPASVDRSSKERRCDREADNQDRSLPDQSQADQCSIASIQSAGPYGNTGPLEPRKSNDDTGFPLPDLAGQDSNSSSRFTSHTAPTEMSSTTLSASKPRIKLDGPDTARWRNELASQPRDLRSRAREHCHDEYNAWLRKRRYRKYQAQGLPRPPKRRLMEAQIVGISMSSLWDDIHSILSGESRNASSLSTYHESDARSSSRSEFPASITAPAQQPISAPAESTAVTSPRGKKKRYEPRQTRSNVTKRSVFRWPRGFRRRNGRTANSQN